MSTDAIVAVFTGLTGVLGALGALLATRARTAGVSRRELRQAQRYGLAADRWIFVLERELARLGRGLPDGKPKELLGDDDPDDGAAPPREVARA